MRIKKGESKMIRINGKTAPLLVIGAGICWGIIGIFSRHLAYIGFSPIQITFARSLVTAIVVTVLLLCKGEERKTVALRDSWMFLGTGLCSIVFFNICYFTAMELTTLSMAAILLYTAPSIVMVLSILLFKESFTAIKGICLVLSFIGCICVSGLGVGAVNLAGILAGLGAGLGYALYSIFSRYALAKYTPMMVTVWTFIIASLGLVGFSDIPAMAELISDAPIAALYILLLGVVSTALPFCLYTVALKHMDTGKASILASVEPLTSTLVGVVVFHESLTALGIGGIVCILGAVVLLNRRK